MSAVHPVPVKLPDPRLPAADWADGFELLVPGRTLTAMDAAKLMFGGLPRWSRSLIRLRNIIAAPLGLKTGSGPDVPAVQRIGIFPILTQDDETVVVGIDDWHLDFRIIVDAKHEAKGSRLRATTLVHRHNLFGRLYIACVTPFHKALVKLALKAAG